MQAVTQEDSMQVGMQEDLEQEPSQEDRHSEVTQQATREERVQETQERVTMQEPPQVFSSPEAAQVDAQLEADSKHAASQGGSMQQAIQENRKQQEKKSVRTGSGGSAQVSTQGARAHEEVQMGEVPESRRDWIQSHPKLLEMMALNVADSTDVYTTFLVYLDLLEARNWHEVRYKVLRDLQQICLYAREKEGQSCQVVVPTSVNNSYSHERISRIMMRTREVEDDEDTPSSVVLAVVASDSTVVYYKLTEGFVVPEPPDMVEDIDNKQFRKKRRKL
ncbi:tRNA-splicing endonuclease subunit Sen15 [Ambystoma mexicanum]|uniref:tRNA-splicing endonuclease subunit Sen15 n=1 Tax=Ambystoma mexicanum TaxID=8296 RepID=UPI0037E8774B